MDATRTAIIGGAARARATASMSGAVRFPRGRGRIIDGRKRLAACEALGVEPKVTAIAGDVRRDDRDRNARRGLAVAGAPDGALVVDVRGPDDAFAAIAPDALKQVFVNLVQNAREAVSQTDTSRRAEIQIDVRDTGGSIVIGVADNGPGIPESERSRVFDPFYSTKREMAGVGLGLFVAEGLVRSAGGRLTVCDAALGGALFEIELRIASAADVRNDRDSRGAALSS